MISLRKSFNFYFRISLLMLSICFFALGSLSTVYAKSINLREVNHDNIGPKKVKIVKGQSAKKVFLKSSKRSAGRPSKCVRYDPPKSSLVLDANTGSILYNENINKHIYPASLCKLMTVYITLSQIDQKKIGLDDKIIISKNAALMPASRMDLAVGDAISVKDALTFTIVKSCNVSAVALGEHIAGSESKFARLMNAQARSLKMNSTKFKNASGWHHPEQKTTAVDLAKLSLSLKERFPNHYPMFSLTSFTFRGKTYNGHNRVTAEYDGAEGLKTGYTNPSGFNLVTVATRNGKTLLGVIAGESSAGARDKKMMKLLDRYFYISDDQRSAACDTDNSFKVSVRHDKLNYKDNAHSKKGFKSPATVERRHRDRIVDIVASSNVSRGNKRKSRRS